MKPRILVVDDEKNIVRTLGEILEDEGYEVASAGRGAAALQAVASDPPHLVLLDILLPDASGLDVLKSIKEAHPDVEVVMISGHATVDRAVEAIRGGAYDFLEKPLALKRVLLTVERALERRHLALDLVSRRAEEEEKYRFVGESAATRALLAQVARVAPTVARVLITGETGTGKELVAWTLHAQSPRRDGPLIRLNCAAIPRELLESELFGHEKGAFTGAHERKPGRFQLADGGTIFLDEIGDMEPGLQAKMLRVLETGEFEPVGGTRTVKVDVRIISATNRDLPTEVRAGRFREDLFHRLNVFEIHITPLRERTDDIPVLARHFLDRYCRANGIPARRLSPAALDWLADQVFPGNVRELRNIVERAAILSRDEEIGPAELAPPTTSRATGDNELLTRTRPLADARAELERAYLESQLAHFGWNISRTATALKVERSNLSRRVKQLGIIKPEPYAQYRQDHA